MQYLTTPSPTQKRQTWTIPGNGEASCEQQQNTEKWFPRHFHREPVSAKITSSSTLHERKCCHYCQENIWMMRGWTSQRQLQVKKLQITMACLAGFSFPATRFLPCENSFWNGTQSRIPWQQSSKRRETEPGQNAEICRRLKSGLPSHH